MFILGYIFGVIFALNVKEIERIGSVKLVKKYVEKIKAFVVWLKDEDDISKGVSNHKNKDFDRR